MGKVLHALVPCGVELSSRSHVAEEYLRYRGALGLSVVSGPDYSADIVYVLELLHLDTAQSLHDYDSAGIHGSNGLDKLDLIARKVEGEAVGLLGGGVLIGTYEYKRHIGLLGSAEGLGSDLLVLGSVIYQIEGLGTVESETEHIGLHGGAGSVYAAYPLAGSPGGLERREQVAACGIHAGLDDSSLGRDVHAEGDLVDIGEIDTLVCGPRAVVNRTHLLLGAHAGTYRDTLGRGRELGGVVPGGAAVRLGKFEVCHIEQVALALRAAAGRELHVDVEPLVGNIVAYTLVGRDAAALLGTAGVGSELDLVCLGTYHGYGLHGREVHGKGLDRSAGNGLILEEHRSAGSDLHCESLIPLGVHGLGREHGIGNHGGGIELACTHTDREHVHESPVDLGHAEQALLVGGDRSPLVDISAVAVDSGLETGSRCLLGSLDIVVSGVDVLDRGAVTGHIALHAVCAAREGIEIEGARRGRDAVYGVV